jgi:hypothetical protein
MNMTIGIFMDCALLMSLKGKMLEGHIPPSLSLLTTYINMVPTVLHKAMGKHG